MSKIKPSLRRIVDIALGDIVSNVNNPRDVIPELTVVGYGLWESPNVDGEGQATTPPLAALALSESLEERNRFVKLIRDHQPDIEHLSQDLLANGQLQPAIVRSIENGKYDLVLGCRRWLAGLFNNCTVPDYVGTICCIVSEDTDEQAKSKAFAENIARRQISLMEEAEYYKTLKAKKFDTKAIASLCNVDVQIVRLRLRLLGLPAELQGQVHRGEMSQAEGLAWLDKQKKKAAGVEPSAKKPKTSKLALSYKDVVGIYVSDLTVSEDTRQWIAEVLLDIEYQPLDEMRRAERKKAETAA